MVLLPDNTYIDQLKALQKGLREANVPEGVRIIDRAIVYIEYLEDVIEKGQFEICAKDSN